MNEQGTIDTPSEMVNRLWPRLSRRRTRAKVVVVCAAREQIRKAMLEEAIKLDKDHVGGMCPFGDVLRTFALKLGSGT